MTLHRGPKEHPTPITDGLVEREARISHFQRELEALDEFPFSISRRLMITDKLADAIKDRNAYLWGIPNIRAMVEFFPELDNFQPAYDESKYL